MAQDIATTFNTNTRKKKHIMDENMVKYTKKVEGKISSLKKNNFS